MRQFTLNPNHHPRMALLFKVMTITRVSIIQHYSKLWFIPVSKPHQLVNLLIALMIWSNGDSHKSQLLKMKTTSTRTKKCVKTPDVPSSSDTLPTWHHVVWENTLDIFVNIRWFLASSQLVEVLKKISWRFWLTITSETLHSMEQLLDLWAITELETWLFLMITTLNLRCGLSHLFRSFMKNKRRLETLNLALHLRSPTELVKRWMKRTIQKKKRVFITGAIRITSPCFAQHSQMVPSETSCISINIEKRDLFVILTEISDWLMIFLWKLRNLVRSLLVVELSSIISITQILWEMVLIFLSLSTLLKNLMDLMLVLDLMRLSHGVKLLLEQNQPRYMPRLLLSGQSLWVRHSLEISSSHIEHEYKCYNNWIDDVR